MQRFFQAASNYVQHLRALPSVKEFLVVWRFNPALSSYYGCFFERMIGLTKTHLRRVFKTSLVTYEEFNTVLTEVEAVVNCRPLAYVVDKLFWEKPLTPSLLLMGFKLNTLPVPEELQKSDTTYWDPVKINRRYKYLLSLIAKFQKIWSKNYLLNLKQSWSVSDHSNVRIGDVVLIEGDCPRLKGKLDM